jgi:CubicO group peptidase (beta-lactamase class C family)
MKSKIDAAVQKLLTESGVPSAQVGIAEGGTVVFTGAYGLARIEPPVASTVEMQYGVGSVSKQFTAAAAMLLVERGKLRLDDPVSTWFPELAHSHEVTLRNLLNQISGYSDYYTEDYLTPEMATKTTPLALVTRWASRPLDFAPGTKWQYSNTNYGLVALIVEKVAGEPFFDFLRTNILLPAGLTHVIDLGGPNVPAVPQGYMHFGFGPPRATPREGSGTVFGAGQLAMPIGDLLLWDTVVMKRKVLKPTSWQMMQSEVALPDGSGSGYGMGFFLRARNGRRVVEHSGGLTGFTTENLFYPENDVAIGVVVNGEKGAGKLGRAIEDIVFAPGAAKPITADAVSMALTRNALEQLADGRLDRSVLTGNLDFFFTGEVMADYKSSLAPFGQIKTLEAMGPPEERGGMDFWYYKVTAANGTYLVNMYLTKDGKLDQLLLFKQP